MAEDQTNPFTQYGMMQMLQPNKYIDPAYKDKPLPIPGFYGTPTDAQGKPIQSFTDAQAAHDAWQPPAAPPQTLGTTLNSPSGGNPFANVNIPQGQNAAVSQPFAGMGREAWNALTPTQRSAAQGPMSQYASGLAMMPSGNNFVASGSNPSGSNPQASNALAWMNAGGSNFDQMANQGQPQAPAPTNPVDMRQAYLTALSNPGKVTTPGAQVPQAQPLGQPSVLNSFLAANPSGGSPAPAGGGYGNAGFFNTLNKLRSA